MTTPRRRATYDDLCAVPDHLVAELIEGELHVTPRPAAPHALAASVIGGDLVSLFNRPPGDPRGPGGWWILDEPELHFGDDVLVPDLAGWRRQHMPVLSSVAAFEQAPDWACEVVWPRTGALDRGRKMRIYARERVARLRIVDPIPRTLEVYRLEEGRWIVASTHGGPEVVRAEAFTAEEPGMGRG